jgi:hypothetical protein
MSNERSASQSVSTATSEFEDEPTRNIHENEGRNNIETPVSGIRPCLRLRIRVWHVVLARTGLRASLVRPLVMKVDEVIDRVHHVQLQVHEYLRNLNVTWKTMRNHDRNVQRHLAPGRGSQ